MVAFVENMFISVRIVAVNTNMITIMMSFLLLLQSFNIKNIHAHPLSTQADLYVDPKIA
jgi:hypothetical protein